MKKILISIIGSIVVSLSLTNCKKQAPAENLSSSGIDVKKVDQLRIISKLKNVSSIKQSITSAQPVTYTKLCTGQTYSETAVPNSIEQASDFDFYYFEGRAGDIVTIYISRTGNCYMDPAMSLFYGTTNDLTGVNYVGGGYHMTFLTYADDEMVPVCGNTCFADPLLSDYVLPYTGKYTIAVFDFLSCGPGPLTFDITITGTAPCSIIIDGCNSKVSNKLLPSGKFMLEEILALGKKAKNHGQFVSLATRLTNAWKAAGLITGAEKGRIMSCIGASGLGR